MVTIGFGWKIRMRITDPTIAGSTPSFWLFKATPCCCRWCILKLINYPSHRTTQVPVGSMPFAKATRWILVGNQCPSARANSPAKVCTNISSRSGVAKVDRSSSKHWERTLHSSPLQTMKRAAVSLRMVSSMCRKNTVTADQ